VGEKTKRKIKLGREKKRTDRPRPEEECLREMKSLDGTSVQIEQLKKGTAGRGRVLV
jgi:hypothetical protein